MRRARACQIIHELPGRVRIGCPGLQHLPNEASEIGRRLGALPGVRTVRVSAITENVLVHFDSGRAGAQDILAAAQSTLNEYSLAVFKAERTLAAQSTVQERRLQENSVGEILTRVLASAATLGFSFFSTREAPTTLLGRFTTVPALTSLSLAWPILQSGWRSLAQTGRPNADTLEFHRDCSQPVFRARPRGADDHRSGGPGGTAYRLYDGPYAPRHSRHARRRRSVCLARRMAGKCRFRSSRCASKIGLW